MSYTGRILICCIIISCTSKQQSKQVYDKASLKAFVLSTRSITLTEAASKLDSILNTASADSSVLHQTISFLQTSFSNPNSSYRNQNLYLKLLQSQLQSKWYGEYEKRMAADKVKLLQQNNVGNAANDFTYTTPLGQQQRMYDVKTDLLLILFYNPECNACKEMKAAFISSPVLNAKQFTGELKILAVYTDKDESIWRRHLPELPKEWLNGRDKDQYLYKNKIYDLHAIPTIYLLDKGKKVLLKDCTDIALIEKEILKR